VQVCRADWPVQYTGAEGASDETIKASTRAKLRQRNSFVGIVARAVPPTGGRSFQYK